MVGVEGRDGIGETAFLRRLREDPDGAYRGLRLDAVVYLFGRGHRWVTTSALLTDLARPRATTRKPMRPRWMSTSPGAAGSTPWPARPATAVVVVIHDADELVDQHRRCTERELHELILTLAEHPDGHDITMITCFRNRPETFFDDLAGRPRPCDSTAGWTEAGPSVAVLRAGSSRPSRASPAGDHEHR